MMSKSYCKVGAVCALGCTLQMVTCSRRFSTSHDLDRTVKVAKGLISPEDRRFIRAASTAAAFSSASTAQQPPKWSQFLQKKLFLYTFEARETLRKKWHFRKMKSRAGRKGMERLRELVEKPLAAMDLDKTLFVEDANFEQFKKNLHALQRFEAAGGIGFPVTGNNLQMAGKKFDKVQEEDLQKWNSKGLRNKPGIYVNGAYIQGLHGRVIQQSALQSMKATTTPAQPGNLGQKTMDGFEFLLQFVKEKVFTDEGISKFGHIGLHFISGRESYVLDGSNMNPVRGHLGGKLFLEENEYPVHTGDELIQKINEDVFAPALTAVFVWPVEEEIEREYKGNFGSKDFVEKHYADNIRPKQILVMEALQQYTKELFGPEEAHKMEYEIKPLAAPWPELDVNVKGINKGASLERFLEDEEVREHLKLEPFVDTTTTSDVVPTSTDKNTLDEEQNLQKLRRDVMTKVAVYGDAANDEGMFKALPKTGEQVALRVGMTDRCSQLGNLPNVQAEVDQVLNLATAVMKAKLQTVGDVRGLDDTDKAALSEMLGGEAYTPDAFIGFTQTTARTGGRRSSTNKRKRTSKKSPFLAQSQ
ncbi:unnamed protein product [Amoebophrya sp. A120]|nr:unnamed protein product [Amoebophrya sp. A120]|eukprot:GSA120T00020380001.1